MRINRSCLMLLTGMLASTLITTAAPPDYFVYTGTYTQKNSKGIYVYGFNSSTGALTAMGLAAEVANPSFLAVHPNRRFLFAVSEMDSGQNKVGSVGAFSIDPKTGKLTFLNHVASHGSGRRDRTHTASAYRQTTTSYWPPILDSTRCWCTVLTLCADCSIPTTLRLEKLRPDQVRAILSFIRAAGTFTSLTKCSVLSLPSCMTPHTDHCA